MDRYTYIYEGKEEERLGGVVAEGREERKGRETGRKEGRKGGEKRGGKGK